MMSHLPVIPRRSRRDARSRAGFSVLELLVVVAILLILFTIYWGLAGKNTRVGERKSCAKNLQRTLIAMEIFATDHGGKFPEVPGAKTPAEALDLLLPKYTVDASAFICPASKDAELPSGVSIARQKISYAYFMGRRKGAAGELLFSDRQVDALPKTAGQAVFSATGQAPGNNHGNAGGNFLFTDGRVEWSPPRLPFSLALPPGVVLLNP